MGDFDWENQTVLVQRAVVQTRVGDTKTETSSPPLRLDPVLATHLKKPREQSFFKASGHWVFANDEGRPRWQETILTRQLKPVALRAGIGKIGWHTFRHTYSTMLRSAGTDIKVQQELLRHANIQTTMNIYSQAVSDQKRAAKARLWKWCLHPRKQGLRQHFLRMGAKGRQMQRGCSFRNVLQVTDSRELERPET